MGKCDEVYIEYEAKLTDSLKNLYFYFTLFHYTFVLYIVTRVRCVKSKSKVYKRTNEAFLLLTLSRIKSRVPIYIYLVCRVKMLDVYITYAEYALNATSRIGGFPRA